MINRGLPKKSQYIFNAKTGKIEKKEKNVQTIESLSKQASKQANNLDEIGEEANKKNNGEPITQIVAITTEDNLVHNYFYDFEYSWDAANCLSPATIKMPKLNDENVNYWATYQGTVTIYGGYNLELDKVNDANKNNTEQDTANALAEFNVNSDIKPFFRGTVQRIKEHNTHIILYLDNIGVRFKQKIPDEFRQSYINNQNVRDAFQAICEFIGVEYICPPHIETANTSETGTNGSENDVSTQEDALKNAADTAKQMVEDAAKTASDQINNSNNQVNQQEILSNTQNTTNQNSNTPTPNDSNSTADNTTDPNATNGAENQPLTDNKEIDVQLNGFADINFDANGAIVHGSTAIETSPDMAETLVQLEENPLDKYLDDETGIVEKVQKFLDGDMFEELHNNVMDYGAITVQPKSTTTSNISSSNVGNTNTSDLSNQSNSNSNSNSNSDSSSNSSTHASNVPLPSADAIRRHAGPKALSKAYINTMSPQQAKKTLLLHKNTGQYTKDTLQKLLWRSFGMTLH